MNDLLNVIPESWRPWLLGLIIASPYLTRAYHALATGGGLRGVASAIWMGTNTPKESVEVKIQRASTTENSSDVPTRIVT